MKLENPKKNRFIDFSYPNKAMQYNVYRKNYAHTILKVLRGA